MNILSSSLSKSYHILILYYWNKAVRCSCVTHHKTDILLGIIYYDNNRLKQIVSPNEQLRYVFVNWKSLWMGPYCKKIVYCLFYIEMPYVMFIRLKTTYSFAVKCKRWKEEYRFGKTLSTKTSLIRKWLKPYQSYHWWIR